MNRPIENIRRALFGTAGPELLTELGCADWNVPVAKKIEMQADLAIGINLGLRRKRNEDRVGVAQVRSLCGQGFSIAVVCDGVGGSEMGDMAAAIALATCIGDLAELEQPTPVRELLPHIIRSMDDAVRRSLSGKGTTTASVLLASSKGDIVAANIGDSRLFEWGQAEQKLRQVSVDDTIENELQNIPGAGISAINARGLQGSLSQALGEAGRSSSDLRIVVFERGEFSQGVVIASDGAWKSSPEGFAAIASNAPSALDLVRRTIASALWMGGVDNVSIIAIQDVEQFIALAKDDVNSVHRNRIILWFADVKLVLSNACGKPATSIRTSVVRESDKPNSQSARKAANKSTGKNRRKRDNDDGIQQLDLRVDGGIQNSPPYEGERPKIVISTDDDTKKTE